MKTYDDDRPAVASEPVRAGTMELPDPAAAGLDWESITLAGLLDRAAKKWGRRRFLHTVDNELSFATANDLSAQMAAGLRQIGVSPGDKVATLMGNTTQFAITYFAVARLGAVLVPLHTRYVEAEVESVLSRSGASTLVMADHFYRQDFVEMICRICPELETAVPGELRAAALPDLRRIVVCGDPCPGSFDYGDVAAAEAGSEDTDVDPRSLLQIKYTSGSTAAPKGVMITHADAIRNAYNMGARIGLGEEDRVFSGMPFYHAGGSILTLLTCLALGSSAFVLPRFEAGEAIEVIERHRCTAHLGMEIMFLREIEHPDYDWSRVSTLRKGWIAGSTEAVSRVFAAMPFPFVNIYGLTEASGNVCMTRPQDPDEVRLGSSGQAQPGLEVRIFDPSDRTLLGAGEVGEIGVRGWAIMEGYYGDEAATRAVIDDDGWLLPGDLGFIDDHGYLKFLGRSRESLKVGGENVSTLEIEELLMSHPEVNLAAVVGAPDDFYGEIPIAFVETAGGADIRDDLLALCADHLAPFKTPREVYFISSGEWPMTGPEKIARGSLRELAGQKWSGSHA